MLRGNSGGKNGPRKVRRRKKRKCREWKNWMDLEGEIISSLENKVEGKIG